MEMADLTEMRRDLDMAKVELLEIKARNKMLEEQLEKKSLSLKRMTDRVEVEVNKLRLSWAKLNSSLANYARCSSCFQLDCLRCENCQYRYIRYLTQSHIIH